MLEAEIPFIVKVIRRFDLPYKHDALCPDPISAVLIIAWLIGNGHSCFESRLVVA